MKKRRMMASRAEKFTRFGIRKCSLGAVSVAIATGLAFLGSGAVQAEQLTVSLSARLWRTKLAQLQLRL